MGDRDELWSQNLSLNYYLKNQGYYMKVWGLLSVYIQVVHLLVANFFWVRKSKILPNVHWCNLQEPHRICHLFVHGWISIIHTLAIPGEGSDSDCGGGGGTTTVDNDTNHTVWSLCTCDTIVSQNSLWNHLADQTTEPRKLFLN